MKREKPWTNCCWKIMNGGCKKSNCHCFQDYRLWSKDNPKLDYEEWRMLAKVEYTKG